MWSWIRNRQPREARARVGPPRPASIGGGELDRRDRSEPENALAVGPRQGRSLLSWRANSSSRQQAWSSALVLHSVEAGQNSVKQRPPYGSPKAHRCPLFDDFFRGCGSRGVTTCGPASIYELRGGGDPCGLRSTRRWARVHEDSVGRGADREPVDLRDRRDH